MDDLASHIAHRRAQLAELRTMEADGHTGAAEAIERVRAHLAQLGAGDDDQADDQADDQVDDQVEHEEPAVENYAVTVAMEELPPAVAAKPRAAAKPAGKAKRKR